MAFSSKNNLFHSNSIKGVEFFESLNIESKFDLDRKTAVALLLYGQCPIAEDFLSDLCKAGIFRSDLEKKMKKGNYCPLKVGRFIQDEINKMMKELGYKSHPVTVACGD